MSLWTQQQQARNASWVLKDVKQSEIRMEVMEENKKWGWLYWSLYSNPNEDENRSWEKDYDSADGNSWKVYKRLKSNKDEMQLRPAFGRRPKKTKLAKKYGLDDCNSLSGIASILLIHISTCNQGWI